MIIEKLRLRGMTGIKKGLGLDEIEIDFNNISGLVALDGINGSGKSTCIELLSPFNQLASREGALFRHTFLRDSERELSFTYQGKHYKTLIKIDCDSEKSEGYIWVDGEPVINGKISQYVKYMKDLFGSPDLFYNSVFCSQNAKKLSDLTTGKLKELFSEFLRLDRYVEYENTAKQCANIITGKVEQINIRIEGLQKKLTEKHRIESEYIISNEHLDALTFGLDRKKAELKSYRELAENLKEKLSQNAILQQRKADLTANISRLQVELGREKSAVDTEIEAQKVKYREVSAELKKFEAVISLENAINEAGNTEAWLNNQISDLNKVVEQFAEENTKNQVEIHRLESELLIQRQKVRDLDNDPALREIEHRTAETDINISSRERAIEELDKDRKSYELEMKIKRYKESIKKLDFRDPRCPEGENSCLFIKDAIAARDALPRAELEHEERQVAIEKEGAQIKAEIGHYAAELKKLNEDKVKRGAETKEAKALLAAEILKTDMAIKSENIVNSKRADRIKITKENIQTVQKKLSEVKALSERQAELQIAITRKADISQKLADITTAGKALKDTYLEKERVKLLEIQELVIKQAEIDKGINHGAESDLAIAKSNIEDAEKSVPQIETRIADCRDNISKANHELSGMMEAEKELESIQAQKSELLKTAAEWTYLKIACSKNGLQALEIDGAAPLITGYANELLTKSFGTMYSVKLLTQGEEGKEALDIIVIGEDGSEDLLANKSGGEKVFCLMALRLAMTLLSTEKSGRKFETAFSDESDGALDPENALNYVALYRSFMEVGGFKNFFFISHRSECRNKADHVLTFERGKNPYWR